MPTYDYECTHCGHKFEAFQKINDSYLEKCPKCQHKVKRLISGGSGLIFSRHNNFYTSGRDPAQKLSSGAGKGSGFYATDYKKKPRSGDPQACPEAKKGCTGCQNA